MIEDDEELRELLNKKAKELSTPKAETSRDSLGGAKPVRVTDADFDTFIKSNGLCVIDFWAEWCGPCKYMEPIVEQLASELKGKVVFGKLNVDENPETTQRFQVMSIPTMIVFKNAEPAHVIVGAMPKNTLMNQLAPFID
jgi:thioredoxin 1